MATKVIVVGGGASGMMAAGRAAELGAEVHVLEKMNQPGKKLLITGKGRCNITNYSDRDNLIKNMPGNGSFLFSAFSAFSNYDLISFLQERGVETKVERGDRVFPVSDDAEDVTRVFRAYAEQYGSKIITNSPVTEILCEQGHVTGIKIAGGKIFPADKIILATGGASYPGTGSTGDGYKMAEKLGHTIQPLRPALVPLETGEAWVKELQGLTLKNVAATAYCGERVLDRDFGELLFTHFGVSGPIILSLSGKIASAFAKDNAQEVQIRINLKPALSEEQLYARLQRDFTEFARKQFKNALHKLLPHKLIPVVVDLSGISGEKAVHQITREERRRIVQLLMNLRLTVTKSRPLEEAIVTAGGVSVREINPKTMESKIVKGLYFAGEVIDIDGYTGGFNLQAAFSTGYAAGTHAAQG